MQMDILFPVGRKAFLRLWSAAPTNPFGTHASSFPRTYCSRNSSQLPERNGDDNNGSDQNGGKFSMDWDKAWSNFRRQGKKTSKFSPNKYVSWNPRPSNYPPSEEIDPIKRTERSNLMLWTSQTFTLAVAVAIVTLLLIYTLLAPTR